jgi:phosphonatase-like hydrolase
LKIKAVLFDLIGTTVKENDPNLIMNCFGKAFTDHHIPFDADLIKANRGRDKMEIIELVLMKEGLSLANATHVYNSFKINFARNIDNFSPNSGTLDIINFLQERKIKIGLGTGLPRDLFELVFAQLKWSDEMVDYIGIGNEVGKARPHPDMINDMMSKLSLINKKEFLKVGDTVADIEEGKNAGVMTAALLAGTQSNEALVKAKPDFNLKRLSDLKRIIETS